MSAIRGEEDSDINGDSSSSFDKHHDDDAHDEEDTGLRRRRCQGSSSHDEDDDGEEGEDIELSEDEKEEEENEVDIVEEENLDDKAAGDQSMHKDEAICDLCNSEVNISLKGTTTNLTQHLRRNHKEQETKIIVESLASRECLEVFWKMAVIITSQCQF
ncbi:hypothetical protein PsorP6_005226 [Peronosclerospora sorghi]|uniref:Uncharacterized protein n=1 Tax=Peronosclerospora sorghi TaxID=230839 RepID=A0ACC0W3S8_9STRA|nr:hypothetical protein PsorP6_005226 [Peronosclerospora sorghi]